MKIKLPGHTDYVELDTAKWASFHDTTGRKASGIRRDVINAVADPERERFLFASGVLQPLPPKKAKRP